MSSDATQREMTRLPRTARVWLAALLPIVLLACEAELGVEAGPDRSVAACAPVELEAAVFGEPDELDWQIAGVPLLGRKEEGARLSFTAPAVAVPTPLTLRLTAYRGEADPVADEVVVTVLPAPQDPALAAGMTPGCAPFRHGVASGDPQPHRVVLWTRITPEPGEGPVIEATFELARDTGFEQIVKAGRTEALAALDYTVNVDVGDLAPGQTYYYRFRHADGRLSEIGRTRTAPVGDVDRLRMGVASCSSIYSGFFNAYRRMAERDLDLVVHVGDYVYDFVDAQEVVRVPPHPPVDPGSLDEWRAVHAFYLSDPDLRAARAAHPWFMLWDNHDVEARARPDFNGSVQAFREWNPIRNQVPDPSRPEILYRHLAYGDLADLYQVDILLHRNVDTVPGTNAPSLLGTEQFAWLAEALQASRATWRVIGTQKLFSTLRVAPLLAQFIAGEPREVFDTNTWDGFPESRTQLLSLLRDQGIDDNVILTGDAHISLAFDLVDDPANPAAPYDPATSDASVGVEFMPASVSRGNFDETLEGELGFQGGMLQAVLELVLTATSPLNPHMVFGEIVQHGWGVLTLYPDRAVAEFLYSDILDRSEVERRGPVLTAFRGENRWSRALSCPDGVAGAGLSLVNFQADTLCTP